MDGVAGRHRRWLLINIPRNGIETFSGCRFALIQYVGFRAVDITVGEYAGPSWELCLSVCHFAEHEWVAELEPLLPLRGDADAEVRLVAGFVNGLTVEIAAAGP